MSLDSLVMVIYIFQVGARSCIDFYMKAHIFYYKAIPSILVLTRLRHYESRTPILPSVRQDLRAGVLPQAQ